MNIQKSIVAFFFLSVLMLSSCSSSTKEYVIKKHKNGKPSLVKYFELSDHDSILVKEVQYYSGGQKRIEGKYKNNRKDGYWVYWFENGLVWSEGYFSQDIRTGKTKVYHENGEMFYEGEYVEGGKNGKWEFYNIEGELVNEIHFDHGKMIKQSPVNKDKK